MTKVGHDGTLKTITFALAVLVCWPRLSLAVEDYCEGDGCPIKYEVGGFDVRVSPRLYTSVNFSHARLGLALDTIRAQLSYIDPPDPNQGIPNQAITALQEAVSFYVSDIANIEEDDPWWPCGSSPSGCYHNVKARIGIGITSLFRYHLYDGRILHELAHAYHGLVIEDGDQNACIEEAYRRAIPAYDRVLNNYHWSGVQPHEGKRYQVGYAATNQYEWFAEGAEAYWFYNGSFPFFRHSLWVIDPIAYRIHLAFWSDPQAECPLWAD